MSTTIERAPHLRCYTPEEAAARGLDGHPAARTLLLGRHGEAAHQWRGAVARASGGGCRCFDPAASAELRAACPFLDNALTDAPLTPHGRMQVRGKGLGLGVERVYAATMLRSLQTAAEAFGHVPLVALESLRPRIGAHRHSRRLPLSALRAAFSTAHFSDATDDADTLWRPDDEPRDWIDRRLALFLRLLAGRPERRVGLVLHFTVFLALFSPADDTLLFGTNTARRADDRAWFDVSNSTGAEALRAWLEPGEVRPCVVLPDR